MLGVGLLLAAGPGTVLFSQDFEKVAEGAPPEDLQVLNGEYAVKKAEGNGLWSWRRIRWIRTACFLGLRIRVRTRCRRRVWAEASGKRMPEFGVGACGPDSFRLWLMPAVGQLQLLSRSDVMKQVAFKWESGTGCGSSCR